MLANSQWEEPTTRSPITMPKDTDSPLARSISQQTHRSRTRSSPAWPTQLQAEEGSASAHGAQEEPSVGSPVAPRDSNAIDSLQARSYRDLNFTHAGKQRKRTRMLTPRREGRLKSLEKRPRQSRSSPARIWRQSQHHRKLQQKDQARRSQSRRRWHQYLAGYP